MPSCLISNVFLNHSRTLDDGSLVHLDLHLEAWQVQPGQDYVYHVRAVNFIGVGQASSQSLLLRAGNAPAAPGLPSIASRALTSLTVQWAPPRAAGLRDLAYRLFMSGPLDGGVYQEIYNGPDTAFTKAMLTTGTTYLFRVAAVNHIGASIEKRDGTKKEEKGDLKAYMISDLETHAI